MVSFSCEVCGDVLTKKKLDPHRNRCRDATFTCLDCMVHFPGTEYRAHTSCISEDQKYQGALYKNKKAKTTASTSTPAPNNMAHSAYVEDVPDEYDEWRDYEIHDDDDRSIAAPPEAPTPPNADDAGVNVFDFLVPNGTPAVSNHSHPRAAVVRLSEDTSLVRYDYDANAYLDSLGHMDDEAMVQYGTGPIPSSAYDTPAPKGERKKTKDGEKEIKKDKKRKRLHVEILEHDQIMTDAPPVLHSGLTGGLNRMMTRQSVFPPSPDYSGGDVAETPASPLKKTKHSKHSKSSRTETIGNSLMAMISSASGTKAKSKTKKRKSIGTAKKHHQPSRHQQRLEAPTETKLIEYRPGTASGSGDENNKDSKQMVIYRPRAELLMSFISKGPESERGCSMNKALKRFHRERSASGNSLSKLMEEKELWRSLRMKRNERGEVVLFCV